MQRLTQRYNGEDKHDPAKPDYLDRFLEAQKDNPESIDTTRILIYLQINLAAGADTTAVTVRSIFYLCLKHPATWDRLQAEVLAAPFAQKETMNLPAPFSQARAILYLEAVVREALRLYPGSCFAMEKYVPKGGLDLPDGSFIPEGVAVGFNPYIIHRNKDIWGPDAEDFRPERWLRDESNGESEDAYKQRLAGMNSYDLSFGSGNHACMGKNLGLMEVYKIVATLVALYEFELADPRKVWKIHNRIFPIQSGIEMRIKKRPGVYVREDEGLDE